MAESLNCKFEMDKSISIVAGNNNLPKIILSHESNSCAEVYLHGGHVTRWSVPGKGELFFLSRESLFAMGKPIRGGIPICFPQFGSHGTLPAHGFARISDWEVVRRETLGNNVIVVELQLSETPETLAIWPHNFILRLKILLDVRTLTLALEVVNTGKEPFDFQAALHTYFSVADIKKTAITGLRGVTYKDALQDLAEAVEFAPEIRFGGETDRVYINAPDRLQISDGGNGRIITIEKSNMPDVVVWNPWVEKSRRLADFGDDEYLRMVCVETGRIADPVTLEPGGRWQGETMFSC
ncbi:MAG: D-hexose-6-phosphate mutarotase [Armatimonadota bacterium]|nr:D-hexose-6-phosphate mutarotase [Armatimonadota bacterium]